MRGGIPSLWALTKNRSGAVFQGAERIWAAALSGSEGSVADEAAPLAPALYSWLLAARLRWGRA
jgi:hypothetical protein